MAIDPKIYDDLLVTDFGQCSEHLRHYDGSFTTNVQFGITGLVAVLTACGALLGTYHFRPLIVTIDAVILIAAAQGSTLVLTSCARNRWTFTTVSRYVNEIRGLYLAQHPAAVQNLAGLFTDPTFPQLADRESSHAKQLKLLTTCFGFLFGLGVGAVFLALGLFIASRFQRNWFLPGLAIFVFALTAVSAYVWSRTQWNHIWSGFEAADKNRVKAAAAS